MSDAGIAELTRGIGPYRRGNTGIDFVHLIESGRPGPRAMIMGLTHGNEPCGMWAVTRLLDLGFRPARGRLSLGLGNIAAYAYLQAGLESQTRFLHRDLKRLWRDDWIDGDGESSEARLARELRPHLRTVDVLLDLHSTASVPRPFFVLAELPKIRALADAMAWPATQQLMPEGAPPRRLRPLSDPADPACALSVECGRNTPILRVARSHGERRFASSWCSACCRRSRPIGWARRRRPLPSSLPGGRSPARPSKFIERVRFLGRLPPSTV